MGINTALFLLSFTIARAVTTDTSESMQDYNLTKNNSINSEFMTENKIKAMRIEMVKFQIKSKLNLTEESPPIQRSPEAAKEIIRILMEEEKQIQQERERMLNTENKMVIHAEKSNLRCLYSNTTYCRMYHFELNQVSNTSSVDLWIYKPLEYPKWITISLSSPASNDRKRYEVLYYEVHRAGWSKLQLPKLFISPSWNESSYTIEIIGQNVEYIGELQPFLLVSKLDSIPSRQRREVDCDPNESCCWRPFRISFAEIGLNTILYPSEIEANLCVGKCNIDPSLVKTLYELAMLKVLENDNDLKDSLGSCWTVCCMPKELEPVRLIYNTSEGIIHDQYVQDLSVKSCGCT